VATNPPKGDGHRNGAVKERSQHQRNDGNWQKRNTGTGQFMPVKDDGKPYKGVRRER
jgi:hypothetical protein